MLKALHIRNYVLIESLAVRFDKGFVAITGETGSGKSILLDAFSLLLGERADSKAIRQGKDKCSVEALVEIQSNSFQSFFAEHDLDLSEEVLVRREINKQGKSRAFINDTPVTLQTLRLFTEQLVDLHSQHENALLFRRNFRYELVDAFSKSEGAFQTYKKAFANWKQVQVDLTDLQHQLQQVQSTEDYRLFQLNELSQFDFSTWDVTQMENDLNLQQHSGETITALSHIVNVLEGNDESALTQLKIAKQHLAKVAPTSPILEKLLAQLESAIEDIKETSSDLERFAEQIQLNPEQALKLEEELSFVYKMIRKHNLADHAALCELKDSLTNESLSTEKLQEEIQQCELLLIQAEKEVREAATKLSQLRMKGIQLSEKSIGTALRKLNLEHAQFQIECKSSEALHAYGAEELSFSFSANKGQPFEDIKNVASGGELSRVMLAIKAASSEWKQMPVLILDEIDQGVGGETANRIADLLKEMATQSQLIVITHLPQIASKANQHFEVSKTTQGNTTESALNELSMSQREQALAHMLAGAKAGDAALQTARELLGAQA